MATEMRLPELGENIASAEVLTILVQVGDRIERDQPVVELETEKATAEVPSTVSGKVTGIHVRAGDKIEVGQLLLTVEDAGGSSRPAPEAAQPAAKSSPSPAAPRATPSAPTPAPAQAQASGSGPGARRATSGSTGATGHRPEPGGRTPAPASPSVRKLARELGVEIADVPGTAAGGRVTDEDVKRFAKGVISGSGAPASGQAPRATAPPLPDFSRFGEIERQPLTGVRRATAAAMAVAWSTIPHVTQNDIADVTDLDAFRKRHAPRLAADGIRLTMTAILVKLAAGALKAFPRLNSSLDLEKGEVITKKYIHIGIAVDTERGLIVPVVRNVDRLSLRELASTITSLAEKARGQKATREDLSGGSFTVTNLGGVGTTTFTPIVNWPEVAILGLGRAALQPVWEETTRTFLPRLVLPLSLSFDHRVIDGAEAARFLRWIAEAAENPLLLVLGD